MLVTFEIWQLPISNNLTFREYSTWEKMEKKPEWPDYVKVYERTGDVGSFNPKAYLERIFEEFNMERPNDFYGRSLSVSDVVRINGLSYFCDICGWNDLTDF